MVQMLTLTLLISTFLSMLFIYVFTPISLTLLIISQSTILSILLFIVTAISWFSFILLIIFIRGIIIIFIYVSSLASNKLIITPNKPFIIFSFFLLFFSSLIAYSPLLTNLNFLNSSLSSQLKDNTLIIYKIYSPMLALLTSTFIIYLLLALFVVIKTASTSKAPLRRNP